MVFDIIYSEYDAGEIGIPITSYATGFLLEGQRLPYISLQGVNHTVNDRYSNLEQLETCNVSFIVFAETETEIKTAFDGLATTYVKDISGFSKVQFGGSQIKQVEAQLYFGSYSLVIWYQREANLTSIASVPITRDTFKEAIYQRWVDQAIGIDFVTDALVLEGQTLPYAVIPDFTFSPGSETTCDRMESDTFSIQLFDQRLVDVETAIDNIIDAFNYAKLTCNDSTISDMQHAAHSYVELVPQVWRGDVSFTLSLQQNY